MVMSSPFKAKLISSFPRSEMRVMRRLFWNVRLTSYRFVVAPGAPLTVVIPRRSSRASTAGRHRAGLDEAARADGRLNHWRRCDMGAPCDTISRCRRFGEFGV